MGVAITPSQLGSVPDRQEKLLPFSAAESGPGFAELLARREFQHGSFGGDDTFHDLREHPQPRGREAQDERDERAPGLAPHRGEDPAASTLAVAPREPGRGESRDTRRLAEDRSSRKDRASEPDARDAESSRADAPAVRDASRSARAGDRQPERAVASSGERAPRHEGASPGRVGGHAAPEGAGKEGPVGAEVATGAEAGAVAEAEAAPEVEVRTKAPAVPEGASASTEIDGANGPDPADVTSEPTTADDALETATAEAEQPDAAPTDGDPVEATDAPSGAETKAKGPSGGEERRTVAQSLAPDVSANRVGAVRVADGVAGAEPAREAVSTASAPRGVAAAATAASGVAAATAPDTGLGEGAGDSGSSSRGSSGEPGAGSRAAVPVGGAAAAATTGKSSVVSATVLPEGDASISWAERVAERVRLTRGADRIELRLELLPKGLGQIDVRLRVDAEGLHAVIFAEHEQTRALLATQQHRLEAALAQEDLKLTSFDLGFDAEGDESQPGEERRAGSRRDSDAPESAETDRGGEALSTTPAPATSGRLNFWA